MAAKQNHLGNWVKVFTIINIVGLLLVGILTLHLVKNVKKLAINAANNASQNTITNANYTCDGGKTIDAVYFDDKVELNLSGGESLLLMQGISASGVRYTNSDESVTFWNKGNTAFIEEGPNGTVTYNNCNQTASQ